MNESQVGRPVKRLERTRGAHLLHLNGPPSQVKEKLAFKSLLPLLSLGYTSCKTPEAKKAAKVID